MPAPHAIHVTTEKYRIVFGYPGVSHAEVDQSVADDFLPVTPVYKLNLNDYRVRGYGSTWQMFGPMTFEATQKITEARADGATVGYRDNLVYISPLKKDITLILTTETGEYRIPMRYEE